MDARDKLREWAQRIVDEGPYLAAPDFEEQQRAETVLDLLKQMEGKVLVPEEPTEEMLKAGSESILDSGRVRVVFAPELREAYKAMIAARRDND